MKPNAFLTLATLALTTAVAFSQGGSLTPPPGAPAPGMKSLDLVEPRIPLVAGAPGVAIGEFGTITISQPGSYYLTGNVQITGNDLGIVINASGVSLDLMGYSIIAPATGNASDGIRINNNRNNIFVHNGHIMSTTTFDGTTFTPGGFFDGISVYQSNNVRISNISVRGVREYGFYSTGGNCLVKNCSISICGGRGISNPGGTVIDSTVDGVGNIGIMGSIVANCNVDNALNTGISANTVANSYAKSISTGSNGIEATTVENSIGITSGQHGISASTVSNSKGQSTNSSNGRLGIFASGGQVSSSQGQAAGGHGISAGSVSNSVGSSTGAHGENSSGIFADRVSNSRGAANSPSGGSGITGMSSVNGSHGTSSGYIGIWCPNGNVSDSYGESTANAATARGIEAQNVVNSRGLSTHANGGAGIYASALAVNSVGSSNGSHGIYALRAVSNCYGFTNHTSAASHGIRCPATVTGSHGRSNGNGGGSGINAYIVTSSYGYAAAGAHTGIFATIVEASHGQRATLEDGKYGISANRVSLSLSTNGTFIIHKYNMP